MAIPGSPDPDSKRDGDAWEAPAEGASSGAAFPLAEAARDGQQLSLGDDDVRLPWLESDEDDEEYQGGGGQLIGLVLMGLLALAVIGGAVWWYVQRSDSELVADGGVIKAPAVPYKEKPADPGGKTFDGTGDTSFAVSEGQTRPARLGLAPSPVPAPGPTAAAKPGGAAADTGGVGVQIAAYSSRAQAEAGWTRLSGQYAAQLGSARHRIVEGRADIGTVYRLQVVAPDASAAAALCRDLKAAGLACQVKN